MKFPRAGALALAAGGTAGLGPTGFIPVEKMPQRYPRLSSAEAFFHRGELGGA